MCPHLEDFEFWCGSLEVAAPLLCPRLRCLQSLTTLRLDGAYHDAVFPDDAADVAATICSLSNLQSLSLRAAQHDSCCYVLCAIDRLGTGCLADLTRLVLHMHGEHESEVPDSADAAAVVGALRAHTGLRDVCLAACALPDDTALQLWRALQAMPDLHHLGLHSISVCTAF